MRGAQVNNRVIAKSWVSVKDKHCSDCSRVVEKLFNLQGLDTDTVWTHKSCTCNELIALKNRHQLFDGHTYTTQLDLKGVLKRKAKRLTAVSYDIVISHAKSGKKQLLKSAKESLANKPLTQQDGRVRMFLKDDKYHTEIIGAPRCIQYRNKRYCLPLASYLMPIEEYVYSWIDESGTAIFAKARNHTQRGRDIQAKFDHFRHPVVLSMDHSKFDSHVNMDLLEVEHDFYRSCNRSKELAKLLKMQKHNFGLTKNGTTYYTPGTRMSGDQNTGLGNSLLNYAMTIALLESLQLKACYYFDGDDYLIFMDRSNVNKIQPNMYNQFGMVTKLDSVATQMESIEFCQCRPVWDGDGYTMVRNPMRMITRLPWLIGRYGEKYKKNYIYSVGLCMMSIGCGLPVEQYIGEQLSKGGGLYKVTSQHHPASKMQFKPGRAKVIEPSVRTRQSYWQAWNITPQEQERLENLQYCQPTSSGLEEQPFARFYYGTKKSH